MPTFATTQLHLPLSEAFVAQSVGLAGLTSLVPLSGALSDRIGRKSILIAAFLPYLGLAYPLFAWVHANPTFANLLIMQVVLCSFLGAFSARSPRYLRSNFRPKYAPRRSVSFPTWRPWDSAVSHRSTSRG